MESGVRRHTGRAGARSVRPQQHKSRSTPASDDEIAFAPVTRLSRWIETRKLTSERLTNIYLARIEKFDPKLRCVITLTRDHALARAKRADAEIAAGKYHGPLHGIPYGVKDLLDTANSRRRMAPNRFAIACRRRTARWCAARTTRARC